MSRATEVRWFVAGDGPALAECAVRSFIDRYWGVLDPERSVKVRDRNTAITKVRLAVHDPLVIAGIEGTPETWVRTLSRSQDLRSTGSWFDVDKQVTRRDGVEVARVRLGEAAWWSVAVRLRRGGIPPLPSEVAAHLARHRAELISCSYPSWIGMCAGLDGSSQLASPRASGVCDAGVAS